jgi:hypothetical protein
LNGSHKSRVLRNPEIPAIPFLPIKAQYYLSRNIPFPCSHPLSDELKVVWFGTFSDCAIADRHQSCTLMASQRFTGRIRLRRTKRRNGTDLFSENKSVPFLLIGSRINDHALRPAHFFCGLLSLGQVTAADQ